MMKSADEEIMCALIGQVSAALNASITGRTEQDVTTLITRPLWNKWCQAVKIPQNCTPTDWSGAKATRRVYGSKTIVVESNRLASISFVIE